MRNYIGYIIDYSDGNLSERKRRWFENELVQNEVLRKEFHLFRQVNSSMRGKIDCEEVMHDPNHKELTLSTKFMVSDFHKNPEKFDLAKTFIENSLINGLDSGLQESMNETSNDAIKHNVMEVTKQWVEEWNANSKKDNDEFIKRRSFISSSLNDDTPEYNTPTIRTRKNFAVRIIGFAAAALIGTFLVIKSLTPSNDPEIIYKEFYKPINAFTSTTRNSTNTVDPFSSAIEKYKQGQFQVAGVMFSDLIYEDSTNISYRFFSGITQMELGNYEQSIELLKEVVSNNGDFRKEAQWYLGLAYIKAGETLKATQILEELSQIKGYYQTSAQDLLNRLR